MDGEINQIKKQMKDLTEYIEEQLKEIDIKEIVENEVRKAVTEEIKKTVKDTIYDSIKTEADKIMRKELELALKNEVQTNDGWGKIKTYPSFEDLFRQTFHDKLNATWEVKRTIEKTVKDKVDQLYTESGKDFMNAFSDYIKENFKK